MFPWRKAIAFVKTASVRAYLFMAFSCAAAFLWPLRPDLCPFLPLSPMIWFSALGMVVLSFRRLYGVRPSVPAPELYIFVYALVVNTFINHLPYQVRSLDRQLYFFDYNFGYAGMAVGKAYRLWSLAGGILGLTYNSLMLAVTVCYLALPGASTQRRFVAAVVLAGTLILPLYLVCPAAGPKYLLRDAFPWHVPDAAQPPGAAAMPPMNPSPDGMNAIPSGHFAWALLIFWFARHYGGKLALWTAGVYAALTAFATLGTGEHYVIDLVLSVPFAAWIWALVHRHWSFAGVALAVVLAWLTALREEWALSIPPAAVWLFAAATIAVFALKVAGAPRNYISLTNS
jgi:hypothetical protein